MRHVLKCLAFTALAAALTCAAEPPRSGAYNVLLVSLDTLRADHVGCYGYGRDTSPSLDKLAKEGVLFENVTAASSWTVPSHMSFFTSLYPSAHGVEKTTKCLGQGVPTMAELLSKRGYNTAAFVTGSMLNHAMGFDRGFGLYDDFSVDLAYDIGGLGEQSAGEQGLNGVSTNRLITGLAAKWLGRNASAPFFLFVHYWDCHNDYTPPPPYDAKYDPDYEGPEDGRDILRRKARLELDTAGEVRERIVALYDGEVAHTDAHVGKLLKALDDLKLSEKTLVIVFSDHGEGFWEHGKLLHGYGLNEELLHVPLIMRLPKVLPEDLRIKGNVSHVDVLPTTLGLLGLPQPEITHGADLSGACRGRQEIPKRPVFSELNNGEYDMRAVYWGPYKMVQESGKPASPLIIVHNGKESEATAAGAQEEALRELRAEMSAALVSGIPAAAGPDRLAKPSGLDEKTLRLLQSLGYL